MSKAKVAKPKPKTVKPASEKESRSAAGKKSAVKPAAKALTKPATKVATKSVAKPITTAVAKPIIKAATKPAAKTETKPAAKPAKAVSKPGAKDSVQPAAKPAASATVSPPPKKTNPAAGKPGTEIGTLPGKDLPGKSGVVAVLPGVLTASGLGVSPPRNPGLSVSPGVMFLGRSLPAKAEPAQKQPERRLSKKEQAEIKTLLSEKRERLLAGMRRELAMQKERAESKAADEVDKATDAYDEDLSFEIATANDQELEEIQVALEKIEKGTYGECEFCGCAIAPSRLKVLPSATTCKACRSQEEQSRRRDDGLPAFGILGGGEDAAEPETDPQ